MTTLFNKITVNNVPLGTLADVVAYMMIISGALLMIIAILGICGAWKEVTGCLWAVSNIYMASKVEHHLYFCGNNIQTTVNKFFIEHGKSLSGVKLCINM